LLKSRGNLSPYFFPMVANMKTFPIIIEKNIPLPESKRGREGRSLYEFIKKMEVGDSAVVYKPSKKVSSASRSWLASKNLPYKVTVQAIDSNSCRLWRIK
jgi:hypothetical protein